MLKFPPELVVHKSGALCLLSAVGGLMVALSAGAQCVDAALRTAREPDNLLRLANAIVALVGLGHRTGTAREVRHSGGTTGHVQSVVEQKLKKLHFTESFCSLLDMTNSPLRQTFDFHTLHAFPDKQSNLESTPANWISLQRSRIYYVFFCGVSGRLAAVQCARSGGATACRRVHPLQWLADVGGTTRTRGDVTVFLFLFRGRNAKPIRTGSEVDDATLDRGPSGLTLGVSALSVVLLWIYAPQFALCLVVCLLWKESRRFG